MHDPLALAIAIDPSLADLADDARRGRDRRHVDARRDRDRPARDPPQPVAHRMDARGQRARGARRGRAGVHVALHRTAARARRGVRVRRAVKVEARRSSRCSARSTSTSSSRARRCPGPGETVTGGVFAQHHGGKGGNQAVAAARAIARDVVPLAAGPRGGRLDARRGRRRPAGGGRAAKRSARTASDRSRGRRSRDAPTGVALIAVGVDGENQISVAPGANDALAARATSSTRSRRSSRTSCS